MDFQNSIAKVDEENIVLKTKKGEIILSKSKVDSIQIYHSQKKLVSFFYLLILTSFLSLIFINTYMNFLMFIFVSIFSIFLILIAISYWIGEYIIEYVISGKKYKVKYGISRFKEVKEFNEYCKKGILRK